MRLIYFLGFVWFLAMGILIFAGVYVPKTITIGMIYTAFAFTLLGDAVSE